MMRKTLLLLASCVTLLGATAWAENSSNDYERVQAMFPGKKITQMKNGFMVEGTNGQPTYVYKTEFGYWVPRGKGGDQVVLRVTNSPSQTSSNTAVSTKRKLPASR